MKKLLISISILAFVIICLTTSCGKDNVNAKKEKKEFIIPIYLDSNGNEIKK